MKTATFRFYEELNDFLPDNKKKVSFQYSFEGSPAIKDSIQAIGVPHVEIDLILVNSFPVDFSYKLQQDDTVSVYPVFESLDISNINKLRRKPLRNPKFILDAHLGKLAKYLRMLGFNTLYQNDYRDEEIIKIALNQRRIILTRDLGILKCKEVSRGYWIRSQMPKKQLQEVLKRFDLSYHSKPFKRCMKCNGLIKEIDKEKVVALLKPKTIRIFQEFYSCNKCKSIYWKGSHYEKMLLEVLGLTKRKVD
jgi:uncharacterized protein